MKTFELSGKVRESVGKKDAKKLRGEGLVPCVLYGVCRRANPLLNYSR